jgi:hypothetical protein
VVTFFRLVRFLWALRRWRAGVVPSRPHRRLLIRAIETAPASARTGTDIWFGPALRQSVMDKARRRRMAVWRARSMMTPGERLDVAMRGCLNAVEKMLAGAARCH